MKITMKTRTNAPAEDVEAQALRTIQVRPEVVEAAAVTAAEAAAQEEEGTDQETAPETLEALEARASLPPEMQRQAEAEAEEATTTMMMMIQAQEEEEEVALQVIHEQQGQQAQRQVESGPRGLSINTAPQISPCLGDCLPKWPPNLFIQKIYGRQHMQVY